MREAPSRVIVEALAKRDARLRAYDPAAMDEARRLMGTIPLLSFATSQNDALAGADALVMITEGRNSATRTSTRSRRHCASRWCSTGASSTTRR